MPGTGFKHRPYTDPEQFKRGDHIPVMDGRYVFKMASAARPGEKASGCVSDVPRGRSRGPARSRAGPKAQLLETAARARVKSTILLRGVIVDP